MSGTDLVIVRDYSALALGVGYAWILVSFEGLLLGVDLASFVPVTTCFANPRLLYRSSRPPPRIAGSIKLTPNGDGTYLIEDQGNTGLNTSDGEGPIAGQAGRTVLIGTFSPATLGITTIQLNLADRHPAGDAACGDVPDTPG